MRRAKLLDSALQQRAAFEGEVIDRLARVEENLRLLRQELVGNGRPGRIAQLEQRLDEVRSTQIRERGVIAGISLAVSVVAGWLARWMRF